MRTLRKLLDLLTPAERRRALLLVGMVLVMALLDLVGVASIMPFMAVLADPSLVETNAILAKAYSTLGFTDPQRFLFFLGVLVFVLLITSLAFKALTSYVQLRFSLMREYSIGLRLIEGYLRQPYSWLLTRNSADLGKTILSEVHNVVGNALQPMISLITQSFAAVALLIMLIWIDPKLAFIMGLALGTSYLLIYQACHRFLSRIGSERLRSNKWRFTAVSEAFGAAKEVKVGGLEQVYIDRFSVPAEKYARHQASEQVIRLTPRVALEAVAFGGMLLIVLYLMTESSGLVSALPVIALYAFAGYRLMPAMGQVYAALTQLRFSRPALDVLHADLMRLDPAPAEGGEDRLRLSEAISLKNVTYSYTDPARSVLKGVSLSIRAKTTVAFVGATGSGKTTTIDVILGLLIPQKGTLEVDGVGIDAQNRRAWQRSIGYVPQHIFLADQTVAENIAFGVDRDDICLDSVERAAKIANIHEFVVNELIDGYQTVVGERGVRLSGGQRQRIGIARALYHKPQVLILDEATSALDTRTEQAVMEAIRNLGHEITIILIAHRLSTVRGCDQIFLMDHGQVLSKGDYELLYRTSPQFRDMAKAA